MSQVYTDAELDISGLGKIIASLNLTLQSDVEQRRKAMQMRARSAVQPSLVRQPVAAIVNAAGFATFNMHGPDQGHYWEIAEIVIGGLTTTTTAAGRADVFIGATLEGPTQGTLAVGLAGWRDQTLALPNIAFYGPRQMRLVAFDVMTIIVSGGTVGQQLVAVAYGTDFQEAASMQEWAM